MAQACAGELGPIGHSGGARAGGSGRDVEWSGSWFSATLKYDPWTSPEALLEEVPSLHLDTGTSRPRLDLPRPCTGTPSQHTRLLWVCIPCGGACVHQPALTDVCALLLSTCPCHITETSSSPALFLEVDAQLRVMTARLGGGQAGTFTS